MALHGRVCSASELRLASKTELKENDKSVQDFFTWANSHLPTDDCDPRELRFFLRGSKHCVESAKKKYTRFLAFKKSLPEYLQNFDPYEPGMAELIQGGFMIPLPAYDAHGRRLVLDRSCSVPPCQDKFDRMAKLTHWTCQCLCRVDLQAQIKGVVVISDQNHATFRHFYGYFRHLRLGLSVLTESYPVRMKSCHVINAPAVMKPILAFFRTFASEKIQARFRCNSDGNKGWEEMCHEFGEDSLPLELGGSKYSLQEAIDSWTLVLQQQKPWFSIASRER